MTINLDAINIPSNVFHGNHICIDDCHKLDLENYYSDIVSAILNAESCLPKTNANFQRSFWSEELSNLKESSIDCTNYWKSMGSPKTGPLFDCKKRCHYKYKIAIRKSKAEDESAMNDNLYTDLLNCDSNSFWKSWNKINRVGDTIISRINGETDEQGIADTFADYFESVYGGHDTVEHEKLRRKFHECFSSYYDEHVNDDLTRYYLTWTDMMDIASKIKVGKATAGSIRPEHFLHGCPGLMRHFQILFNGLIQHGFVPTDFLRGTISPIVKDTQGDVSNVSNYRGITLSSLPTKLFAFSNMAFSNGIFCSSCPGMLFSSAGLKFI